jgi:hypothetical protein
MLVGTVAVLYSEFQAQAAAAQSRLTLFHPAILPRNSITGMTVTTGTRPTLP